VQNAPNARSICKVLICTALSAAFAFAASAQTPKWDWSENVAYQDTHDPNAILLDGLRAVDVVYGELKWEDVDAWPKGKPLLLAYSAKTGTVLLDPDSGKRLWVISGLKQHPIDAIVQHFLGRKKGMES